MLLPPGAESHSYEPTPQDILKIKNCDIFIYTGGESDSWIKEILESIGTDGIKVLSMMDCVEPLEEEVAEGMEEEHNASGRKAQRRGACIRRACMDFSPQCNSDRTRQSVKL